MAVVVQPSYKGMVIGRLVARDAERNQSASTLYVAKTDNLETYINVFALSRYHSNSYGFGKRNKDD